MSLPMFPSDFDPDLWNEPFDPATAARAQLEAVEALCQAAGESLDRWTGRPMGELFEQARLVYGEDALPPFWRIWQDWATPGQQQPMGDL